MKYTDQSLEEWLPVVAERAVKISERLGVVHTYFINNIETLFQYLPRLDLIMDLYLSHTERGLENLEKLVEVHKQLSVGG